MTFRQLLNGLAVFFRLLFFLFQFFQAVIQLAGGKSQHLRGLGFVTAAIGQRFFDFFQRMRIGLQIGACLIALNGKTFGFIRFTHRLRLWESGAGQAIGLGGEQIPYLMFVYHIAFGVGDQLAQELFQLLNIARPVVVLELGDGFGREVHVALVIAVDLVQEIGHKLGDVAAAFAQRG